MHGNTKRKQVTKKNTQTKHPDKHGGERDSRLGPTKNKTQKELNKDIN
jgi:hypothetical protein